MQIYRNFGIEAPDYEPMAFYSSDDEDPAAFLAGIQGSYVHPEGDAENA